jgi:hypothetical protein
MRSGVYKFTQKTRHTAFLAIKLRCSFVSQKGRRRRRFEAGKVHFCYFFVNESHLFWPVFMGLPSLLFIQLNQLYLPFAFNYIYSRTLTTTSSTATCFVLEFSNNKCASAGKIKKTLTNSSVYKTVELLILTHIRIQSRMELWVITSRFNTNRSSIQFLYENLFIKIVNREIFLMHVVQRMCLLTLFCTGQLRFFLMAVSTGVAECNVRNSFEMLLFNNECFRRI